MNFLKLDLHIHSIYSGDSLIRPQELLRTAKKKGLNGIAICDHGTLKAYYKLIEINKDPNFIIIPGMEIETEIGEILVFFINKMLHFKTKNFIEIAQKVKDENMLIFLPHPFDLLRSNHIKTHLLNKKIINRYIDGVEVINSRIIFNKFVKRARDFKDKYNLIESGGSDAHTIREIGNAYTLIPNTNDYSLEGVKNSILRNHVTCGGTLSSPFVHLITIYNKLQKGLYF